MKHTLLTFALGAVALALGVGVVIAAERSGWIDSLRADAPTGEVAAATCPHELTREDCPFCTPALVDTLGWCAGHDVPEALCTRCNASLIPAFKVQGDWCAEHGLPESQCTQCGGRGGDGEGDSISTAVVASHETHGTGVGSESPVTPDAEFEILRTKRKPSATCQTPNNIVHLDSEEVTRRTGLEFATIEPRTIEETVSGNAAIAFDAERYAHLSPRAPGTIETVHARLGDRVSKGDVLAVIDSTALGAAKADYLQARSLVSLWEKNHAREQSLFEQNVGTEKDVLEAETKLVESRISLSSAKQRLQNLGLDDEAIERVAVEEDTSSDLPMVAPFDGVIVERHAVTGEVVDTEESLFAIADTSTMWAMLDVYEADAAQLQPGQSVKLSVEGLVDRTFEGTLTWISSSVDPRTRTIRARAELENSEGLLRANMFGRALVEVQQIDDALLVPADAVQWDGCCNLVFVRHTDTMYQPYKVTLGRQFGDHYVVEKGLPPGETIVTDGSFLLKTEILKGNIGAGCCEVDPGATRSAEEG